MPFFKPQFAPGVNKDDTELVAEPMWTDSDKVRFRLGKPEKIGGWTQFATGVLEGVPRACKAFESNDGLKHLAVGTSKKLYLFIGEATPLLVDITPVKESGTLVGETFSFTNGSADVDVTFSGHESTSGNFVTFNSATETVSGVDMNTEFEIQSVTSDDVFVVALGASATNTVVSSGSVGYALQIDIGLDDSVLGLGWGIGGYGLLGYDETRTAGGVLQEARTWFLDTFGEDVVAAVNGGALYTWDLSSGSNNPAELISGGPDVVLGGLVVSPEDRHLVVFGGDHTASGERRPLSIDWSDQEDLSVWDATALNTAGDVILSGASRIKAARRTRGETLFWTESTFNSMVFDGPPFTFSISQLGDSAGLVGPNAVVTHQELAFWMGPNEFFMYDGVVRPIPNNTVRFFVFDNIDPDQMVKVFAYVNPEFSEVTWQYETTGAGEIDAYVTYNFAQGVWYTGTLDRTCWVSQGVYSKPIGFGATGTVFEHESGTDDLGSGLVSFIESGDVDIGDGTLVQLISAILPDFDLSGSVEILIKTRRYPQASQIEKGPFTVSGSTQRINVRARGRQAAYRVSSSGVGDDWRLGAMGFEVQDDGER